jgi:catechol 2,3-dioxygenase-like lactoylglutathione lyase family enzyme
MTAPELFHVGILVADLDEAIARWSKALGLRFAPVMGQEVTVKDPEPHKDTASAAYSLDGPPYIELVQARPTGHLSLEANGGEGLHHLGLWAAPHADYVKSPLGVALPPVVSICSFTDEPDMWLTDRTALNGVTLEMVSDVMRPGLAAMLGAG